MGVNRTGERDRPATRRIFLRGSGLFGKMASYPTKGIMKFFLAMLLVASSSTIASARQSDATLTEIRALALDWGNLTVTGVAVSADGSKIAAVAASVPKDKPAGSVVIFDFKTGKAETQFETDERFEQVAFAKGGELITRGQSVRIWDVKAKQPTRTIGEKEAGGPLRAMAISPDGKKLAIAAKSAKPVTLWDLAGGEGKALWEEKEAVEVASLSFDGKGERLVVGGYRGNCARVYEMGSRKLISELKDGAPRLFSDVVISRDGHFVATSAPRIGSAEQDKGLVFSVNKGKMCSTLISTGSAPVKPLGVSPDGLTLLASNFSAARGGGGNFCLALYEMYGGRYYANTVLFGPASAAAFVDDDWIVAASPDANGAERLAVYQLTLKPEFKTAAEEFKETWLHRYK